MSINNNLDKRRDFIYLICKHTHNTVYCTEKALEVKWTLYDNSDGSIQWIIYQWITSGSLVTTIIIFYSIFFYQFCIKFTGLY